MKLVKHIPAKLHVLCDRDLIQRVVINLLHNAVKWSPEGGAVTIEAEVSGEEVAVSVLDNGPGVPADQVERIFERFYQVDPSRSGKDGTGLGLAICKHIVTAHGGRIWAEGNQMGSGGKFRLRCLRQSPWRAVRHWLTTRLLEWEFILFLVPATMYSFITLYVRHRWVLRSIEFNKGDLL